MAATVRRGTISVDGVQNFPAYFRYAFFSETYSTTSVLWASGRYSSLIPVAPCTVSTTTLPISSPSGAIILPTVMGSGCLSRGCTPRRTPSESSDRKLNGLTSMGWVLVFFMVVFTSTYWWLLRAWGMLEGKVNPGCWSLTVMVLSEKVAVSPNSTTPPAASAGGAASSLFATP